MTLARVLVDRRAVGENRFVVPGMTLRRSDEADRAVQVLLVVPADEPRQ